jgi:hypothetical protein
MSAPVLCTVNTSPFRVPANTRPVESIAKAKTLSCVSPVLSQLVPLSVARNTPAVVCCTKKSMSGVQHTACRVSCHELSSSGGSAETKAPISRALKCRIMLSGVLAWCYEARMALTIGQLHLPTAFRNGRSLFYCRRSRRLLAGTLSFLKGLDGRQGRRDHHWWKVVGLRWDATHPSNPGSTCSRRVRPDESGSSVAGREETLTT